jgi:pSer/pThr/pTyr-binding forkhead associated (FHA) protein
VNGDRISETVTLSHGDAIKVGTTTLRLELPPSMRGPKPGDATVIA